MKKTKITKLQFESYERVRRGGAFNMAMESARAASAADLSHLEYAEIRQHYAEYLRRWSDVRGSACGPRDV